MCAKGINLGSDSFAINLANLSVYQYFPMQKIKKLIKVMKQLKSIAAYRIKRSESVSHLPVVPGSSGNFQPQLSAQSPG